MWVVLGALAVILVIVVLAVVLAERYAGARLRGELIQRSQGVLGVPPKVDLDLARPLLLQLFSRRLAGVRMDTRRAAAHLPHAILLDGHAQGVQTVPDGVHVDDLRATVTLRQSWIAHVVAAAQAGRDEAKDMMVRAVSLSPRRGAVVLTVGLPVAFGLGVDVRVVVAVTVQDGRLAFRATDLSMPVSVVPVPLPIAWAIDSWVSQLRPKVIPAAVDALTIGAIAWEADAVTLDVTAVDTTVPLHG